MPSQASSEVGLIKVALRRIGMTASFTSIETPTMASEIVAAESYPDIRDEVLASFQWNEAKVRTTLAALEDTPSWGFSRLYQLPSDFISLVMLDDAADYDIEGDRLATDNTSGKIVYIKRLTNVQRMSPRLRMAIIARLAAEFSLALKSSQNMYETFFRVYQDQLAEARYLDASQSAKRFLAGTEYRDAWFGTSDPSASRQVDLGV